MREFPAIEAYGKIMNDIETDHFLKDLDKNAISSVVKKPPNYKIDIEYEIDDNGDIIGDDITEKENEGLSLEKLMIGVG